MHDDTTPTRPPPSSPPPSTELPLLVAVGASAGGLEALTRLLASAETDGSICVVVIQHLSPDYKSMMAELLGQRTALPVLAARDGLPIRADVVYVIEPRTQPLIDGTTLRVRPVSDKRLQQPINDFFESATSYPGEIAAVVLSGTGSDGADGLLAIKRAGGTAVVQRPAEASFDGMPLTAIRTGQVDLVLPALEILPELLTLRRIGPEVYFGLGDTRGNIILRRILDALQGATGIDFGSYKPSTMLRRIQRRMQARDVRDPRAYADLVSVEDAEVDALYADLLIGVTRFFRDPGAINALTELVLPRVLARGGTSPIRAWVAGCSTGEEAYTVAILIAEGLAAAGLTRDYRIFATDIDERALEHAKAGAFSEEAIRRMPRSLRERYFVQRGGQHHVRKEIREHLLFSRHNLIDEPPFTRLDFISCRNLLIYLKSEVQQQVIQTFASALIDDGVLWLGSSETIGDADRDFKTIDSRWRIFQAQAGRRRRMSRASRTMALAPAQSPQKVLRARRNRTLLEAVEESLIGYAPPTLIINSDYQLVYRFGDLDNILRVPMGRMSLDVRDMLPKALSAIIYTAFGRASETHEDLLYRSLRIEDGETFDLRARLLPAHDGDNLLALIFENQRVERTVTEVDAPQIGTELEIELNSARAELMETRDNLQSTIEELESTNEALQSANEELIAANEELQSTNEELHSVNEELHTVNAEHQDKVDQLTAQHKKLDDVLSALELGVVVLDSDLNVQHFNVASTRYFSLIGRDMGRPLGHLSHQLDFPDLLDRCSEALRLDDETVRTTVAAGRTVIVRVHPRRRLSRAAAGVIITIADISGLAPAESTPGIDSILDRTDLAVAVVDHVNQISSFNRAFAERLDRDPDHLVGQGVTDLIAAEEREAAIEGLRSARVGQSRADVIKLRSPSGDAIWEFVEFIPTQEADGARRRVLWVSRPLWGFLPDEVVSRLDLPQSSVWVWTPESERLQTVTDLARVWGLESLEDLGYLDQHLVGDDQQIIARFLGDAATTDAPQRAEARVVYRGRIRVNEMTAARVALFDGGVRIVGVTRVLGEREPRPGELEPLR